MAKFVFVTGGVVSSIGKGIVAASLGRLLKSKGYSVSICYELNDCIFFTKETTKFV